MQSDAIVPPNLPTISNAQALLDSGLKVKLPVYLSGIEVKHLLSLCNETAQRESVFCG